MYRALEYKQSFINHIVFGRIHVILIYMINFIIPRQRTMLCPWSSDGPLIILVRSLSFELIKGKLKYFFTERMCRVEVPAFSNQGQGHT